MLPWNRIPKDMQKAILAMVVLYGGSRGCCIGPMVCDPPPPPSPMIFDAPPRPSSPMICDPPPPPASATPMPSETPTLTKSDTETPPLVTPDVGETPTVMICDPAPWPPPVNIAPGQHFLAKSVTISSQLQQAGARIKGTIIDQNGQPLGGLTITVEGAGMQQESISHYDGTFFFYIENDGVYRLAIKGDEANAQVLKLKQEDVATVEWVESWEQPQMILPLAQIREVAITWDHDLVFIPETPWPGARYRWSISGGTLQQAGDFVTWQPPATPGRYMMQLVADWGQAGLAVDSLVLIVEDDSSVVFG